MAQMAIHISVQLVSCHISVASTPSWNQNIGPDFCTKPRKFLVVVGSESGTLFSATGSLGGAAEADSTDSIANDCSAIDVCWNSPASPLFEDEISDGGEDEYTEGDDGRRPDFGDVDGKSELLNSDARPLPDVGDPDGSSMMTLELRWSPQ